MISISSGCLKDKAGENTGGDITEIVFGESNISISLFNYSCPPFMVRLLLGFLLTISSCILIAQNSAKRWYFGSGAALNFNSGVPVLQSGCAITTSMGCASISDAAGATLFYTDGVNVFNQMNMVMANGSGLSGANAFQSSLIIRKPFSGNLYYVFTVGDLGSGNGLYYSVVDMSLAAGMGSVTSKNVLLQADCRDKLTAARHCNGDDVWIVSAANSSSIACVACAVSATGVAVPVITPTATNIQPVIGLGQMKISPNSRKLGIVSYAAPSSTCGIDVRIFNFDNSTGLVQSAGMANVMYYTYSGSSANCANAVYGCEFSQDSRYLYTSFLNQVNRIDLCALPVISSGLLPNQENNSVYVTTSKRSMQLASDGRIYVAKNGKTSLGAINTPTSVFSASYSSMAVSLNSYTCQWGLPNFPGYLFEQKPPPVFSYSLASGNCLTAFFNPDPICTGTGYSVTAYQWDFGEPSSGAANTSFLSNPTHFYSAPGSYSVTMVRHFQCNGSDTLRQIVNVIAPVISVVNSSFVCSVTSATASVSGAPGTLNYLWSPGSQTTAIGTFTSSGIYTVTATDSGNGFCTVNATTSVLVINLNTSASINAVLCSGGNTGSASVTVSGGSGSYSFLWTGIPSTNSVAVQLSAGPYSVTVLDNLYQCTHSRTLVIPQPAPLQLATGGATLACANQTVSLYSAPAGGVPSYSVTWAGLGNGQNVQVSQSVAGNYSYTCTVTDANNCLLSKTVSLQFMPVPMLSLSNATVCTGSSLTLTANGAATYTWPGGATGNSLVITSPLNGSFVVQGQTGICLGNATGSIQNLPLPSLSVSPVVPICAGQTLTIAAGGNGNFLWLGPSGFTATTALIQVANASLQNSGTYTVRLTDMNACSSSQTVATSILALPPLSAISSATICFGNVVTLSVTGAGTYSWSSGQTGASITLSPQVTTAYTVTGTSLQTGCSASVVSQVLVSACTELSEHSANESVSVFPVPFSEFLNVEVKEEATYCLFSYDGALLSRGYLNVGVTRLDMHLLLPGYYLIEIRSDHIQYYRKMIRQ